MDANILKQICHTNHKQRTNWETILTVNLITELFLNVRKTILTIRTTGAVQKGFKQLSVFLGLTDVIIVKYNQFYVFRL